MTVRYARYFLDLRCQLIWSIQNPMHKYCCLFIGLNFTKRHVIWYWVKLIEHSCTPIYTKLFYKTSNFTGTEVLPRLIKVNVGPKIPFKIVINSTSGWMFLPIDPSLFITIILNDSLRKYLKVGNYLKYFHQGILFKLRILERMLNSSLQIFLCEKWCEIKC